MRTPALKHGANLYQLSSKCFPFGEFARAEFFKYQDQKLCLYNRERVWQLLHNNLHRSYCQFGKVNR